MFREFCLPTMAARFAEMLHSAEAQNWGYRKLLVQLCEAEAADRRERRRQRLLRESKLPSGKTLGNLEEEKLPAKVRRQLPTLLEGGFVERAENLLVFGLPGRGKTHFLCALGRELILRHGCTVYFTPTFKLVQQLLAAKKDLRLDAACSRSWTALTRSSWTTSATCSNRARKWKCSSRFWRSDTSGAACWSAAIWSSRSGTRFSRTR